MFINNGNKVVFNYGVASGDPLHTQVIIWTHAKYNNLENDVYLNYEISLDEKFTEIIKSDIAHTSKNVDFTVKVDVTGLEPNTTYYYRFKNIDDVNNASPIGRTRTIPNSNSVVDSIKFAVVSCSNYARGYFNVYQDIGRLEDINAVIHLGDYIYEYGINGLYNDYGRPFTISRMSNPVDECLTLDDYRKRHAQYKTDTDAQYMHSRHPIISVWDDHEIANNSWVFGAEYENPKVPYMIRKKDAIQAYHEYMPIRTGTDRNIIFRTFDFGNILSLHMLDTRHYNRDKQITHEELLTDPIKYNNLLFSPDRKLLGPLQLEWLTEKMKNSNKPWQVLGNQVLMSDFKMPVSILININKSEELIKSVTEYVTAENTPDEYRTQKQKDLLNPIKNPKYGYNLDSWDGYPAEKEKLYKIIKTLDKKVTVFSGDSHNAWYNDLTNNEGNLIAKEFGVPSVSSPGLELYLKSIPYEQVQQTFKTLCPSVKWCDTHRRGYLITEYTKTQVSVNWRFIDTVDSMNYSRSDPSHKEIIYNI